jgi:hypothetical protein
MQIYKTMGNKFVEFILAGKRGDENSVYFLDVLNAFPPISRLATLVA